MGIFLALALGVIATAYIAMPFYRVETEGGPFEKVRKLSELENMKSEIYTALKDIDFDHQMGKLSNEDYATLKGKYKRDAVQLLKDIDSISPRKKSQSGKNANTVFCTSCGNASEKDDMFCSECGESLS